MMDTAVAMNLSGKDAKAQAQLLRDGHSVVVVCSAKPLPEFLTNQPHGTRLQQKQLPNGSYEIVLRYVQALREVSIERRAGNTILELVAEGPTDSLRERILAPLPRSVPSAFVAPRLRRSEEALRNLDLAEARVQYATFTQEYALRAWAEIRLADIDVLQNEIGSACSRYRASAAGFNDRTAGTVALLRLRALGCPGTTDLELTDTITNVRRIEGPVGDYLRRELVWTLARERDGRDPASVFATLCTPAARRSLATPTSICDGLLAHMLRSQTTPYDLTMWFLRNQEAVTRHPESSSLRLMAAQALLDLELPDQAVPLLEALVHNANNETLWRERQGTLQAAALLVLAYNASGNPYLSHQTAKRFGFAPASVADTPDLTAHPLGRKLLDVRARLDALRTMMTVPPSPTASQQTEEHHEDRTL